MAAIDNTLIAALLNYLTPTGAAGVNGTAIGTPLGTTAMKLRLNSTASSGAAFGTEIANGTGYAAGGWTSLGAVHLVRHPHRGRGAAHHPVGDRHVRLVDRELRPDRQRGVSGASGGCSTPSRSLVGIGNTFQVTGGSGAAAGIQISLT